MIIHIEVGTGFSPGTYRQGKRLSQWRHSWHDKGRNKTPFPERFQQNPYFKRVSTNSK